MALLLITGCASNNTVSEKVFDTSIYAGSEIRVYEVFGMDCPACAGGLSKLVEKNAAVKKSDADWKGNKLIVVLEPGQSFDDDSIYSAVKDASFTAGKRIK